MEEKEDNKRKKAYAMRRAIMDYGMGMIIFCIGVFFLIAPRLGISFNIDDLYRYIFAGLCLVYGIFRIYRGYQKNYFD
jgi:hypothetical protein